MNYEKSVLLKHLKSNYIGEHPFFFSLLLTGKVVLFNPKLKGKFVSVKGTIIRVGSIKPLVVQMDFECSRCAATITCHFVDGKYTAPVSCTTPQCRSKTFEPNRATAVTVDWQKIR